VVGVGGLVAAQGPQEGEHMVVDDLEHLLGGEVLESGPAQILVGSALTVITFGEDTAVPSAFSAAPLCSPPACGGRPIGGETGGR
jgi:hypothetical protein